MQPNYTVWTEAVTCF